MSNTLNDNFQLRADIAQYMQSTPRNSAAWTAAGALHTALRDGLRQVALDIRPWEITEPLEHFSERAESLGLTVAVAPPVYASPGGDAVSPNGSRQGVASQISNNGRQRETAGVEQARSYTARQDEKPPRAAGTPDAALISARDAFLSDAHGHGSTQTEKLQAENVAEREAIVRALRVKNRVTRSRTVSTHIRPEERDEIEQRISGSGLDISAFVREAIREKLNRDKSAEEGTLVLHLNGEQFRKICQLIAAENRGREWPQTG